MNIPSHVYIAGNKGQEIPFTRWNVHHSAYGASGTADLVLGRKALLDLGIDLVALSQADDVEVEIQAPSVFTNLNPLLGIGTGQTPTLFTGLIDVVHERFLEDTVTVSLRDFSSVLLDSPVSGKTFVNRKIKDVIQQFTDEANLSLSAEMEAFFSADANLNKNIGSVLKQDNVRLEMVTDKWSLLHRIAANLANPKQRPYVCMVTPDKRLHFAPQNFLGFPPIEIVYGQAIEELEVRHSPRKNRSFIVIVESHHPKQAKHYQGHYVQHGVGKNPKNLPVYRIEVNDGTSNEECAQRAVAFAKQIAKREIVVTGKTVGDASIVPWVGGMMVSKASSVLEGKVFDIASAAHSYEVPQEGEESGGYAVTFSAWNIAPSETESGVTGL